MKGEFSQIKRDVHTSLALILEILKKSEKNRQPQEVNALMHQLKKFDASSISVSLLSTHSSDKKCDGYCLTERTSRINKVMERSRNDGCIKKPKCGTTKATKK